MLLLIDNFDSFSYILADYFRQSGAELKIFRNDVALSELVQEDWEGLVLSPGPGIPASAGNLMQILDYYHDKLPILGVCLGHQAIGEYFGATLKQSIHPVHGKVHKVFKIGTHPLLNDLPPQFLVTRYHSLELTAIPDCLTVLLETEINEVMAIAHQVYPITGIQYHPEAHLTQYGKEILRNWLIMLPKANGLQP